MHRLLVQLLVKGWTLTVVAVTCETALKTGSVTGERIYTDYCCSNW